MLSPGLVPDAIPINEAQLVDVAVRMINGDPDTTAVWLSRTDAAGTPIEGVGWLNDNGQGADLAAGDRVFSGTRFLNRASSLLLWGTAIRVVTQE
jgi:hypothetical protein